MVVPPCYGEASGFCVLRILRSANLFKIGSRADGIGETEGKAAMESGERAGQ
jgi:hypothetical protein